MPEQEEILRLAQQHNMDVDYVTWFFKYKKEECGLHWFMMLAAMWEGWKGCKTQPLCVYELESDSGTSYGLFSSFEEAKRTIKKFQEIDSRWPTDPPFSYSIEKHEVQ